MISVSGGNGRRYETSWINTSLTALASTGVPIGADGRNCRIVRIAYKPDLPQKLEHAANHFRPVSDELPIFISGSMLRSLITAMPYISGPGDTSNNAHITTFSAGVV